MSQLQEVNLEDTWEKTTLWKHLCDRPNSDSKTKAALEIWLPEIEHVLRAGGTQPLRFTLHDERHAFRVAQCMARLIAEDIPDLSDYEVAILLLSAYLHDIGMVPERVMSKEHMDYLLSGDPGKLNECQCEEFRRWLDAVERGIDIPLRKATPTREDLDLADELTAFYIRSQHNDWSREWIERHHDHIPSLYDGWLDDLILVCQSHHWGRDRLAQKDFEGCIRGIPPQPMQLRYLACILRIADILENDPERTPEVLFKHRGVCKGSAIFWSKDHPLSIKVEKTSVQIVGKPNSALIHKAQLELAADINSELANSAWLRDHSDINGCEGLDRKLLRSWNLEPSARVEISEGSDYQFINGAFRPRTDRLLELIGSEQLYGTPFAAVRELLQNAFDAVREKIAYLRLKETNSALVEHAVNLGNQQLVCLRVYEENGQPCLECRDSGVGMTKQIIEFAMLRCAQGSRGEIRTLQRLCRDARFELGRTGQFGIGVLSYFMLADQVIILTRRSPVASQATSTYDTLQFTIDGLGDFGELRKVSHDLLPDDGTIVKFRLRGKHATDLGRFARQLISRVREYVTHTPCAFHLELPPELKTASAYQFSTGWLRGDEAATELIESSWKKRGGVPPFSSLGFVPLTQVEEQEATAYTNSKSKLHWHTRELMVLDNAVLIRIRLPAFAEEEGLALASFFDGGDHRLSPQSAHIGCYLATPGMLHGSWKGINATFIFHPLRPRDSWFIPSNGNSSKENFDHPFLIEFDILNAPGASLTADRNKVRLSQDFTSLLKRTIREECEALLDSIPLLFADNNPYADFNRWRCGRSVRAAHNSRWFIQDNDSVFFKRWVFPFTTRQSSIRTIFSPSSITTISYCDQPVAQIANAKTVVGTDAYGPFPDGNGLELRPPDRVCLTIKKQGDDDELGFLPLWLASKEWIGTQFPSVWQMVAGFEMGWKTMIWNRDNPLVELAGGVRVLSEEKCDDWKSLWWDTEDEQLRRSVLSCPNHAAQALLRSGLNAPPSKEEGLYELWQELWVVCAKALNTDPAALHFYITKNTELVCHGMAAITQIDWLKRSTWPDDLGLPSSEFETLVVH